MVQREFKITPSLNDNSRNLNDWDIEVDQYLMPLPQIVYEELAGKYLDSEKMIDRIKTITIALAGITDNFNIVDDLSYNRRSVIKSFTLNDTDNDVDTALDYFENTKEYEKYHTVFMDRDTAGNDNSIHAYIETPVNGILRASFSKDVRLNAKRNNIKYWVENYSIISNDGSKPYVRPLTAPIEIM